jgi:hypothetical protein
MGEAFSMNRIVLDQTTSVYHAAIRLAACGSFMSKDMQETPTCLSFFLAYCHERTPYALRHREAHHPTRHPSPL